jgi:DNA recombination protein RmuC
MEELATGIVFLAGMGVGALVTAAAARAILRSERRAGAEKTALLDQAETRLREAFQALSAQALSNNNRSFLELAKTSLAEFQTTAAGDLEQRQKAINDLIKPVHESLAKVDAKLQLVEKERHGHYRELSTQLQASALAQERLHAETTNLVRALRRPSVRGCWGEIQLKRVVEMAGMLERCDFTEQETVEAENGRLRPDLIVQLPGGKNVVVDAKAPLEAYLDALEADDDGVREVKLKEHARQVRAHMIKLGSKSYWEAFPSAPEFVVMFLPGETFFAAALQHDPSLIEYGVDQHVIAASPTTLIALLRAVAYGWQEEKLAKNAREISNLGRALYERLGSLAANFDGVRRGLDRAVEAYNKAVGSLEGRVLASARRFKELGVASSEEIPGGEVIERTTRILQAPELNSPEDENT